MVATDKRSDSYVLYLYSLRIKTRKEIFINVWKTYYTYQHTATIHLLKGWHRIVFVLMRLDCVKKMMAHHTRRVSRYVARQEPNRNRCVLHTYDIYWRQPTIVKDIMQYSWHLGRVYWFGKVKCIDIEMYTIIQGYTKWYTGFKFLLKVVFIR